MGGKVGSGGEEEEEDEDEESGGEEEHPAVRGGRSRYLSHSFSVLFHFRLKSKIMIFLLIDKHQNSSNCHFPALTLFPTSHFLFSA